MKELFIFHGEGASGKSTLVNKLTNGKLSTNYVVYECSVYRPNDLIDSLRLDKNREIAIVMLDGDLDEVHKYIRRDLRERVKTNRDFFIYRLRKEFPHLLISDVSFKRL